ncbi:hypothetical protein [Streptomyces candidus]|uniref:Membrane protein involved in colicin uptake n=1 Tax=Streptomyces candidus TaxID=67283 RepID=A0A7X0HIZ9_9ACTN|nr:hypothetical protein [Streptomyces candidus]MBB6438557.1 membrane protein involved in colicin uptake [Streptomyces candidus]
MSTTPIQNQYMQQLADDLARNTEEQERARAQMEEAQNRLAVLAQEYTWLETMRAQAAAAQATPAADVPAADDAPAAPAADDAPAPPSAEEATAQAPVKAGRTRRKAAKPQNETAATDLPAPADAPADNGGPEAAEPAGATPAEGPKKRAARKPTAQKAAKKVPGQRATAAKAVPAGRTKRGPSLAELVAPLLSADTPRSTKEIVTALKELHPERSTSDQLVRNAINTLISRGKAQRLQQQNSVFYTAASPQDEGVEAAAR